MPLGASDLSRRNAMKTEAVVENLLCNGIDRNQGLMAGGQRSACHGVAMRRRVVAADRDKTMAKALNLKR